VKRVEIRMAGYGGQGLVLAGIILAEAALAEGLNVAQTQSYGPESRGGATRSEIIIAEGEIDYPRVLQPSILLAMSQQAYVTYLPSLAREGVVVLDSTSVTSWTPGENVLAVPITAMARELVGTPVVANMVALGLVASQIGLVSAGAITEAVKRRVPRGSEEVNLKALETGFCAHRQLSIN